MRNKREMTWKRVATAVVLVPGVVALILKGSTAIVALGVALGDIAGTV